MNTFVADPHWGWWIIWYFFLGGIAAGAYFTAALIELRGRDEDQPLAKAGYLLAFPLILVCGVLLILDLNQPLRFWHMLFRSEVVHAALDAGWPWSANGWSLMVGAPLLKYWSPMSIGAWAISLFGLCSFLSFVGSFRPQGWIARMLRRRFVGPMIRVVGCGVGFFVAAYTGVLLAATSQPLWSDSTWLASLFLTSAASTGIAAIYLVGSQIRQTPVEAQTRLLRSDLWALGVELVVFLIFLISLGWLLLPVLKSTNGKLLIFGTLGLGLLVPIVLHWRPRLAAGRDAGTIAAICVLAGGFLLRYAVITTPPEILQSQTEPASSATSAGFFGPEAGREPGARGADSGNRSLDFEPRSKLLGN